MNSAIVDFAAEHLAGQESPRFELKSLEHKAKSRVTNGERRIRLGLMQYWIVKQEPESYSWTAFVNEGKAAWTGVRNYQARNNLRAMKKGDFAFYYHSGDEKQVVGVAKVAKAGYPDPTATEGDWSCVDFVPVKALVRPVSLGVIKSDKFLSNIPLVRNSRLSVSPLNEEQFHRVLELGESKL